MYVTINFDEADTPFELFGNLGKAGGCDSAQLEAISDRKSTRLNSSHELNSYAVFCLKKKKKSQ